MGGSAVPAVVAERRALNRTEFQDFAVVTDPAVRAVFRRAAWALAVAVLLWVGACVLCGFSLVGSARVGSGAFGVTATVFTAVIGVTASTGVALRRLLGGVPSGARWGSGSAGLLSMMGISYVGAMAEAGGGGAQQIAGAGSAGGAGLLMLVLDRAHRTARRAREAGA
ncbi:hypothetical protein [Streptomyces gelaticus]|uniref:hypothetical protein n=1 Tax=Streptomyces gelaticus TaxID=285446 RepID=UPI00167A7138|nr:hypothetical protein [Streptomyces gelaticus]